MGYQMIQIRLERNILKRTGDAIQQQSLITCSEARSAIPATAWLLVACRCGTKEHRTVLANLVCSLLLQVSYEFANAFDQRLPPCPVHSARMWSVTITVSPTSSSSRAERSERMMLAADVLGWMQSVETTRSGRRRFPCMDVCNPISEFACPLCTKTYNNREVEMATVGQYVGLLAYMHVCIFCSSTDDLGPYLQLVISEKCGTSRRLQALGAHDLHVTTRFFLDCN